jgi:uncharacterized protein YutE (UPF0331/DUF86 family)
MTRPANRDVVIERLSRLRSLLDEMRAIGVPAPAQLRTDHVTRYALERLVTLIVDAATALNSHVASRTLDRVATTYAETFDLAAEAGVIDEALASRIRGSAKLRNLLVHDYAEIDYELLAASLQQVLHDYDQYVRQVARWLERDDTGR